MRTRRSSPVESWVMGRWERWRIPISSSAARGKTLILVTHHVEEILPEIQRVVLLREGRVFHDGSKGEMLTGEMLSETFGAPVRVEAAGNGYYSARAV